jgi:hypothetical protein
MTRRRELDRSFHINDWRSAAWPRRSAATEGHVSCNGRVRLRGTRFEHASSSV